MTPEKATTIHTLDQKRRQAVPVSSKGSAYEESVAQKCALAVAGFLRAQGFDDRIYYQGQSGRQGVAFEGNPRRVEIRVLK